MILSLVLALAVPSAPGHQRGRSSLISDFKTGVSPWSVMPETHTTVWTVWPSGDTNWDHHSWPCPVVPQEAGAGEGLLSCLFCKLLGGLSAQSPPPPLEEAGKSWALRPTVLTGLGLAIQQGPNLSDPKSLTDFPGKCCPLRRGKEWGGRAAFLHSPQGEWAS